jgi:ssDNA-binding Zn-finger/Zn-ribbon topoisomerase 1
MKCHQCGEPMNRYRGRSNYFDVCENLDCPNIEVVWGAEA